MDRPIVSVVMPVYNTATFVSQAIESILAQTYANFEFIIVDDASSDNSIEVIRSYTDERIHLIVNSTNQGISQARNQGMAQAQGKYIAVFDSDDISLPYRLEKQVSFLEKHPDYGLVGGQVLPIDLQGNSTGKAWPVHTKAEEIPIRLIFTNCFAQPTVMLRKSALPDEWYNPEFTTAGDYELWTRIARQAKMTNLPLLLVKYRVHDKGITRRTNKDKSIGSIKKIISGQLSYLSVGFSEDELILLQQISRNSYDQKRRLLTRRLNKDEQTLSKCFALLTKIEAANTSRGVYSQKACKKVLREQKHFLVRRYLHHILSARGRYDLRLLAQYYLSPLRLYRFATFDYTAKLSLKCLLGCNSSK